MGSCRGRGLGLKHLPQMEWQVKKQENEVVQQGTTVVFPHRKHLVLHVTYMHIKYALVFWGGSFNSASIFFKAIFENSFWKLLKVKTIRNELFFSWNKRKLDLIKKKGCFFIFYVLASAECPKHSCQNSSFDSSTPTQKEKAFWYVEKSSFVFLLLLLFLPVILSSVMLCRRGQALMARHLSPYAFVCVLLG